MVGPLLALLVDVHLEEGDVEEAARIAQRLDWSRPPSGDRI
jgi:hypothetical protein